MLPATYRSSARLGGRAVLLLFLAAALVWALPTLRGAASLTGGAAGITPEEFARLPEDRQKALLLEGVELIRRKCANISLNTTSHVQIVEVNAVTKQANSVWKDLGSDFFQLRRTGRSFRIEESHYRPKTLDPETRSTQNYDAESGVSRLIATEHLASGKSRPLASIYSTRPRHGFSNCRYMSYLGGLGSAHGFPENDFFGFLLEHRAALRIRGIDPRTGLVEATFAYTPEKPLKRSGSCTLWFDLNKNWMLTRRVWELKGPAADESYERFEVKYAKQFDDIWLPTRFTEVTRISGNNLPKPVGNVWETTAGDIQVGSVKKEDLQVVFPSGILVSDEIAKEQWIVGKAGEKLPYDDPAGGKP